jgi:nucleoside-diphosphate-sugar epimerase
VRALKGRTGQYIFCSTIDVYQKPATRYPYREDEPYGGLNPYSSNKVLCEKLLTEAHQRGDLPVTIIRPAYTYGDSRGILHPVNWGLSYLDRVRRGKPIVVHGDGSSLWVACHVDDVSAAFIGAIDNTKTYGKSYHTTGEEWLTWNRYHQLVAEALGAPEPTLVHIPTDLLVKVAPKHTHLIEENFQFNNIFDNSAARADLGFRYTIPWVEGVRRTVAWLDARHMIPNSDDDPFEDRLIAAWQQAGTALAQAAINLEA